MGKNEFYVVIEHFCWKKWMAPNVKAKFFDVHRDFVLVLKTIYFWINESKRGWTSTKNKVCSGDPDGVITPKMMEKILDIVMEDCQYIR